MQQYKRFILILGDIALFYVALWLALVERGQELISQEVWTNHYPAFTLVLILWLGVFYINDLYSSRGSHRAPVLINRLIVSMLANLVLAAVFFYVTIRLWDIKPQTILLLSTVNYLALLYIWRLVINKVLRTEAFKNTVLFIGHNSITEELISTIEREPQLGYTINAILDGVKDDQSDIPWYELNHKTIQSVLYNHRIDTIVVSAEKYADPDVISSLYKSIKPNVAVVSLPSFYEELTGKIPLNQIGHAWALENLTSKQDRLFLFVKRLIDILSVLILGLITLIIFPFVALIILLSSGRPIFFTQSRVGMHGKEFKAIKFRTMIQDAEKDGAQWSQGKGDSRITPFGHFMRKTRIDELPQLINILKGELSLVGPRPERPEFVENLIQEIPFYKERLLVRPGVSGWAQVEGPAYGGSKEGSLEKLQYDLFYIKNRSLGIELSVILKTIKTVLSRKGQ